MASASAESCRNRRAHVEYIEGFIPYLGLLAFIFCCGLWAEKTLMEDRLKALEDRINKIESQSD